MWNPLIRSLGRFRFEKHSLKKSIRFIETESLLSTKLRDHLMYFSCFSVGRPMPRRVAIGCPRSWMSRNPSLWPWSASSLR
jgi:hypothetical protein